MPWLVARNGDLGGGCVQEWVLPPQSETQQIICIPDPLVQTTWRSGPLLPPKSAPHPELAIVCSLDHRSRTYQPMIRTPSPLPVEPSAPVPPGAARRSPSPLRALPPNSPLSPLHAPRDPLWSAEATATATCRNKQRNAGLGQMRSTSPSRRSSGSSTKTPPPDRSGSPQPSNRSGTYSALPQRSSTATRSRTATPPPKGFATPPPNRAGTPPPPDRHASLMGLQRVRSTHLLRPDTLPADVQGRLHAGAKVSLKIVRADEVRMPRDNVLEAQYGHAIRKDHMMDYAKGLRAHFRKKWHAPPEDFVVEVAVGEVTLRTQAAKLKKKDLVWNEALEVCLCARMHVLLSDPVLCS